MSNNYDKITTYLNSFINYEKNSFFPYKKSLKLERIQYLLNRLDIPYQELKAIHVAGTKGKGSTANFCASILASLGFRVGLYTSPHLFDFRERIKIVHGQQSAVNSYLIPKKEVSIIVEEFRPVLENLRETKKFGKLSFFEIYTALALKYFLDQKVDFAVLETGLGGRLDATNVAKSLVCIITHIGYDHTDKLGRKLSDIAWEKGGIIKEGVPVVCAQQKSSPLEVIRRRARQKRSKLFLYGKDFKIDNLRLKKDYTFFDFKFGSEKLKNLKIYLKGKHQVENTSCALCACYLLKQKGYIKGKLDPKAGLSSAYLEGRFEMMSTNPLVVVDVAHNASSFSALNDSLELYLPCKKKILIFACSKDKDPRKMLKEIDYHYLIITKFNNPRSFGPLELKKICNAKTAYIAEDIKFAFKQARTFYGNDCVIIISGSLFLVSEAKTFLKKRLSFGNYNIGQ